MINIASRLRRLIPTPDIEAVIIALIYVGITLYISIHLLHDSYNTYCFDLGAFMQDLKYTLQGKLLWCPSLATSDLAHHFSPVLLLLVPIYWIFPYAQTLLVVQGLVLGLSGYLVYSLAREYKLSRRASLAVETLFFFNPLVWGIALFDFHPIVFAIPGLICFFFGLKRKNWILFTFGLFITYISREDATITVGIYGAVLLAYNYWKNRKIDRTALIIFASALAAYGIAVGASAATSGGGMPIILSYFTNRYSYVDQPLTQGAISLFATVFSSGTLLLIYGFLFSLGLLPLLSLQSTIPALFILLTGIISTNPGQHNNLLQYTAPAIPFLFLAFIEALPLLEKDQLVRYTVKKTEGRVQLYALVLLLLLSFKIISTGRLETAVLPDWHDVAINQVLSKIPNDTSVSTSNTIFPHICARTDTYLFGWDGDEIAPLAAITNGEWGYPYKETEYIVFDSKEVPPAASSKSSINDIVKNYVLITKIDGVYLYKLP